MPTKSQTSITFFIQNFSRGAGSERAVACVASLLAAQGYNITILSICGDNTSFFEIDPRIRLKTLIPVSSIDNRRSFLKVRHALSEYFKANKVDVCIDVFASLSIYSLSLKRRFGFKCITWEHYNFLNNTGMSKLGRKAALRRSDAVVILTETDRDNYIRFGKKVDPTKLFVIYNPSPYPIQEKPVEKKERIVLGVGRLVDIKRFDRMLDVWSAVEKHCADWQLHIIGDGENRGQLEQLIEDLQLQHVVLVGEVNDMSLFYQRASLLLSTSEMEGLPMVMIEAQSFGIPIVSLDYYTGPRDIIVDGKNGYVACGDSVREQMDQMAAYLVALLESPAALSEMGEASKENASRFSPDIIANQWVNLIESVLVNQS